MRPRAMRARVLLLAVFGSTAGCAAAPGAAPLPGTSWSLDAARGGALAGHARGSGVTLQFQADRLGGYSGCNRYSADYTLSGNELHVGAVTTTKRGCADPAGAVEKAWYAALSAPLKLERGATGLSLVAPDGQVLQFIPAAPGAARP